MKTEGQYTGYKSLIAAERFSLSNIYGAFFSLKVPSKGLLSGKPNSPELSHTGFLKSCPFQMYTTTTTGTQFVLYLYYHQKDKLD